MIKQVVEAYGKLSKRDLRLLRILEVGQHRHEFVPQELVERWARGKREEVLDSLRRLHYLGLIRRNLSPYLGWKITASGYDVLAIHTLRMRRKLLRLSPTPIGVGKESEVYSGETPGGLKVAVKFYRGGVSSFRYEKAFESKVKRFKHLRWVYETRLSALAEFFALGKIFEAGGMVPEPLARTRHVVVMTYIDGVELFRLEGGDYKKIAEDVVETLRTALKLGIVHGDLSPYNILVGSRSYVIDWPQWLPSGHPAALDYLMRDLGNVASYFGEKGVEIPVEELLELARTSGTAGELFTAEINKYIYY